MKPEKLLEKLQGKTKEQIMAYLTLYYKLKIAPKKQLIGGYLWLKET